MSQILALPAPKTLPTKPNGNVRSKCHLNTADCSINQRKTGVTHLTVQACEDDEPYAWEKPFLEVDLYHMKGYRAMKDIEAMPSYNLFEIKTDRPCTLLELRDLAKALLKACEYFPETGIPIA